MSCLFVPFVDFYVHPGYLLFLTLDVAAMELKALAVTGLASDVHPLGASWHAMRYGQQTLGRSTELPPPPKKVLGGPGFVARTFLSTLSVTMTICCNYSYNYN